MSGGAGAVILGIESSCDETAASVVVGGTLVRSNVVASQHELHEGYRGVVPEIASRAHVEQVLPVVEAALRDAGVEAGDVEAVAVGNRPGLIGSLLVGVAAAKALSLAWGVPVLGVDHVLAHLHAWRLHTADEAAIELPEPTPVAPHVGLVVSGGHTSLYRLDSATTRERLGATIDDAVGEAFDKAANILGLPYPGGPNVDAAAERGDAQADGVPRLPRSLLGKASLDLSFSGLKTALLYAVRGHPVGKGDAARFPRSAEELTDAQRDDFAAAFRAAAIEPVLTKLGRALDATPNAAALVLGGGVTANRLLRRGVVELARERGLPLGLPAMPYCTDNAAMIAGAARARLVAGDVDDLMLPALASATP